MDAFRIHRGRVLPLLRRDVDTDQIIPKQFLKSIERTGFGRICSTTGDFARMAAPIPPSS